MYFTALLTIVVCIFSFIARLRVVDVATIEGYLNIGLIQNIDYYNSVIPICFTF